MRSPRPASKTHKAPYVDIPFESATHCGSACLHTSPLCLATSQWINLPNTSCVIGIICPWFSAELRVFCLFIMQSALVRDSSQTDRWIKTWPLQFQSPHRSVGYACLEMLPYAFLWSEVTPHPMQEWLFTRCAESERFQSGRATSRPRTTLFKLSRLLPRIRSGYYFHGIIPQDAVTIVTSGF